MEQFVGGVTAPQLNLMPLDEAEVAVKPPGAEGAAEQDVEALVVAIACADGAEEPLLSTASTT
jgi:hypothetical protein